MSKKKLLIVNSKENIKIDKKYLSYINIGDGRVDIKSSIEINLSNERKKYYCKYKNKLIKLLNKKIKASQLKLNSFVEFEIFNLRNDKIPNINLIINILIVRNIIKKKKFNKISLITDDNLTTRIFKQLFPQIEIVGGNTREVKNNLIFLKITKFYIKSFFVIVFLKFFKKIKLKKNIYKEACLSLKPIFFRNGDEIFFNKKNAVKLNFLLSDETHLNLSLFDIFKLISKKNEENFLNVEYFIYLSDLLKNLIKSYKMFFILRQLNLNFKIDQVDFSDFYKDYVNTSLINRAKLNIYNEALVHLLKNLKVRKFNIYLFEYNFGFFLINLIKTNLKNVKIIGYQHGIFSDKLLWFNLITKNKNKINYLPHEIISFNSQSKKDYEKIIKTNKIKFKIVEKKESEISRHFLSSNNPKHKNYILILPGTHDAREVLDKIKSKVSNNFNIKDIFYFKFHPKYRILENNSKNIRIISSIKNKKFKTALISSTSTLVYDFIKLKKKFMVYDFDNKENFISSGLSKKIKFYKI